MVISPERGARLASLSVAGTTLLGESQNTAVPEAMRAGCFAMAPFAGRLRDGLVDFGGRTWILPTNLGDAAAHGFVYDVPWEIVDTSATSLTTVVELDRRWPFGGKVAQEVTVIEDGVAIRVTLSNDLRAMPGALGLHPWFRRTHGSSHGSIEVEVGPATRFQGSDDGMAPGRPWDHAVSGLDISPRAIWPSDDLGPGGTLAVESDAPSWTLYEQDPDAFCIEPLTHPLGCLASGSGAVVEPGSPLVLTAVFAWHSHRDAA